MSRQQDKRTLPFGIPFKSDRMVAPLSAQTLRQYGIPEDGILPLKPLFGLDITGQADPNIIGKTAAGFKWESSDITINTETKTNFLKMLNADTHEQLESDLPSDAEPISQPSEMKITLQAPQLELVSAVVAAEKRTGTAIILDKDAAEKALSALSLIYANKFNKPTLIIVPSHCMKSWKDQIKEGLCADKIKDPVLYTSANFEHISMESMMDAEIVLTTYAMLHEDFKQILRSAEMGFTTVGEAGENFNRPGVETTGAIYGVAWGRVIVDEAQKVRYINTGTASAVFSLRQESVIGLI